MSNPHPPSFRPPPQYFWLWVMCLLGVDYFSTLAYQPSITFQIAGRLGPIATVVVVLVTLLGALPVYWYVAGRSPHGQGSIALLECLVRGWRGKSLVLLLLGFAATDFIMVKTISLADAAVHIVGNEVAPWQQGLDSLAGWSKQAGKKIAGETVTGYFDKQLVVTLLLVCVGAMFWFLLRKGFTRKVMGLAVPLVALYLLLNVIIIGSGLLYLIRKPEILTAWFEQVQAGDWQVPQERWFSAGHGLLGGWGMITILCLLFFPGLSLGLSGFELSLLLMPQIAGKAHDDPTHPRGRIANTRKALIVAALIMSMLLLGSVFVTHLLIPEQQLLTREQITGHEKIPPGEGQAANRALAYLAHGGPLVDDGEILNPLFGPAFGTLYDLTTIVLLCLAGSSVMTALAFLLPQFLLRFGMQMHWMQRWGLMLVLFALVNLTVTLWFRASVTDQRGAYATAVLVLFTSAGVATVLDRKWIRAKDDGVPARRSILRAVRLYGRVLVALAFLISTAAVMVRAPKGLIIAGCFIVVLFVLSVLSRAMRTNELRTISFEFKDDHSKFLWDSLRLADFPVLVPHRPGWHERDLKEAQIRRDHQLDPAADVVFLEVTVDDPSNFEQRLLIEVFQEDRRFVIRVLHCVSVAHAVAAIALEMSKESKPPGLHFGWSEMDLMTASWSYFAFGEGNVPWKVRELIVRAEPEPEKRPRVIIG